MIRRRYEPEEALHVADSGLEIDRISKRYGETVALRDMTFTVGAGELFGFVGSNGAGKTTTMRIALGVLAADSGEVRFRGAPLDLDVRRRFGYMPEERGLYPKMKVAEQLSYLGELHGMSRERARSAAAHWTDRLGCGTGARSRCSGSASATSSACSSRRPSCTNRTCWCSTSRSPASTRWPWR